MGDQVNYPPVWERSHCDVCLGPFTEEQWDARHDDPDNPELEYHEDCCPNCRQRPDEDMRRVLVIITAHRRTTRRTIARESGLPPWKKHGDRNVRSLLELMPDAVSTIYGSAQTSFYEATVPYIEIGGEP